MIKKKNIGLTSLDIDLVIMGTLTHKLMNFSNPFAPGIPLSRQFVSAFLYMHTA